MMPSTQLDLTQTVIHSLANTPDPRFKRVMTALITKLHEFMSEVDLTPEEWMAGLEFLAATGKMCDERRQEFVLLSDTLGASMLTVMLAQVRAGKLATGKPPTTTETTTTTATTSATEATEATVQGPFYWIGAPDKEFGADIGKGVPGVPTYYSGKVVNTEGQPIAGALLDVWSGDGEGIYDMQYGEEAGMRARARFRTDASGRYAFWSIRPNFYPIPMDGPVGRMFVAMARNENRPGHIHFMLSAPGHLNVTTHIFVANSPYLDTDPVFGVRQSLVVEFKEHPPGKAPDGRVLNAPYWTSEFDFCLDRAAG